MGIAIGDDIDIIILDEVMSGGGKLLDGFDFLLVVVQRSEERKNNQW
jgi:hypothetical protein